MPKHKLIFILVALGIVGCASNSASNSESNRNEYMINYNSEPQGAAIVCNGQNQGYTPQRLYYNISKEERESGNFQTVRCEARWVSGARASYATFWDINEFPDGVMQTLQRPDIPGYQQDAEFAFKVQQQKQANDAAYMQMMQANDAAYMQMMQNEIHNRRVIQNQNKPVTCTTNFGVTTCF